MTPTVSDDDLEAKVLALRADVLASLALSRVAVQTLEALCPDGEWLAADGEFSASALVSDDDDHLISALERALIDAADTLGDAGIAA